MALHGSEKNLKKKKKLLEVRQLPVIPYFNSAYYRACINPVSPYFPLGRSYRVDPSVNLDEE